MFRGDMSFFVAALNPLTILALLVFDICIPRLPLDYVIVWTEVKICGNLLVSLLLSVVIVTLVANIILYPHPALNVEMMPEL